MVEIAKPSQPYEVDNSLFTDRTRLKKQPRFICKRYLFFLTDLITNCYFPTGLFLYKGLCLPLQLFSRFTKANKSIKLGRHNLG